VVVYFFPAPHTSGCNIEAHLFSQAIDQFKALHATVIGVTAGMTTVALPASAMAANFENDFMAGIPGDEGAQRTCRGTQKVPDWMPRAGQRTRCGCR
jgi:peroxiredoxin Q/BCP